MIVLFHVMLLASGIFSPRNFVSQLAFVYTAITSLIVPTLSSAQQHCDVKTSLVTHSYHLQPVASSVLIISSGFVWALDSTSVKYESKSLNNCNGLLLFISSRSPRSVFSSGFYCIRIVYHSEPPFIHVLYCKV
jgi:hypothetical protein